MKENFLAGYTGLEMTLWMAQCGLGEINPRTFYSVALNGQSSLRELNVMGERTVTKFPWDLLIPVAESIQVSFDSFQNFMARKYTFKFSQRGRYNLHCSSFIGFFQSVGTVIINRIRIF